MGRSQERSGRWFVLIAGAWMAASQGLVLLVVFSLVAARVGTPPERALHALRAGGLQSHVDAFVADDDRERALRRLRRQLMVPVELVPGDPYGEPGVLTLARHPEGLMVRAPTKTPSEWVQIGPYVDLAPAWSDALPVLLAALLVAFAAGLAAAWPAARRLETVTLGLRQLATGRRLTLVRPGPGPLGHVERDVLRLQEALDEQHRLIRSQLDDLHAARREASEQARTAQEASRTKSRFLSTMSHELRTPLNAIIGYGEWLLELEAPDDDVVHATTRMVASARHQLALVDDLLDLSRVEAGRMELQVAEVELWPMLLDVADVARAQPYADGVELTVDCDGYDIAAVDVRRLRQVLLNLLSNALRHTMVGGTVRLVGRGHAASVQLSVADSGLGIEPAALERIFEPFGTADNVRRSKGKSTGLGLAVSRALVEQMGGTLIASSAVGVGSTFELQLPRGASTSPQHAVDS